MHQDWAKGSIHRAIIDKRYDQGSLLDVARVALLPKRTVTRFLYPLGGMDRFHEALANRVRRAGGQILLHTPAGRISRFSPRPWVVVGEEEIRPAGCQKDSAHPAVGHGCERFMEAIHPAQGVEEPPVTVRFAKQRDPGRHPGVSPDSVPLVN